MLATWGLIPFFLSKDLDNEFNLRLKSITQFILNIPAIRFNLLVVLKTFQQTQILNYF